MASLQPTLHPIPSAQSSQTALKASPSTDTDEMHDPALVRRLKWKLDLFILPLISSVYFFASMGRSDIANAKVAGLSDELDLSPQDYANATTVFLVAYVLCQLPGTLLIKKIGPPIQLCGAMMAWGTLTALSVLIKNTTHLLVLRFLIGASEAFVQGGYRELATRGAIFYSMSTLAGAFNGLIAYAITRDLDGSGGWRAWRWIFLVEGVLPCAFAPVVLLLLPASPEALRFGFGPREKALAVERSRRAHNSADARLDVRAVPRVLLSPQFWLFTIIACAGHFCQSSLSNFLPSMVKEFGYGVVEAQLLTVIVYACAAAGILFWARVADRTNARGLTLAASAVGAVAGYAVLVGATDARARFAAVCVTAFSVYPTAVLQLTWAAMCFVGYTRRGSALAFFGIFSQLFAISGNQAYLDPPYYRTGNTASLGMAGALLVLPLVLRWYLGFLNRRKTAAKDSDQAALDRPKGLEELGDSHPDFYYTT